MGVYIHAANTVAKPDFTETSALGATPGTVTATQAGIFTPDLDVDSVHVEIRNSLGACLEALLEQSVPLPTTTVAGAHSLPGSGVVTFAVELASIPETDVAVLYGIDYAGLPSSSQILSGQVKKFIEVWLENYSKLN